MNIYIYIIIYIYMYIYIYIYIARIALFTSYPLDSYSYYKITDIGRQFVSAYRVSFVMDIKGRDRDNLKSWSSGSLKT